MAYNRVDYGGNTLIDLTGDTVTPEKLAKGETAHDMTGAQIVGTMDGGGNTLHVTFSASLAGCEYTITNGEETITGTVPDDCVIDVVVSGSGTYTVECEGNDASVDVENVYNVTVEGTVPVYDNYFAVYSTDDSSLTFYGDDSVPDAGTQYNGKTATTIYTGVEDTGSSNPPWYSDRTSFKSALFDASFAGCKPTSCYYWFYGTTNCAAIDGLRYLDTSSVTNMAYMFHNCSGLTSLDVSNFDTSSVTTMSYIFRGCSGLTTLDVSNLDTASVTNMSYMFYKCSGLTTLDVSNFDTSSVTTMAGMFNSCSGLTTIYSDDDVFVTNAVTSGSVMFTDCSKLVGGNGTAYSPGNVTHTMAHIDTASNPGYFTDIADKPD